MSFGQVAYLGYGAGTQTIRMRPAASVTQSETHACLLLSGDTHADFDWTVQLKTDLQLRAPAPNPWEVAWLLWHYSKGADGFESFYYLALKPNGVELGKTGPQYDDGQHYLVTQPTPVFPVGRQYRVRVRQTGPLIEAWAGGTKIISRRDDQHPYLAGQHGLYCEDSAVTFTLTLKEPPA